MKYFLLAFSGRGRPMILNKNFNSIYEVNAELNNLMQSESLREFNIDVNCGEFTKEDCSEARLVFTGTIVSSNEYVINEIGRDFK